ncbi:unnamed protein product, partial [Acanthocheilonema viteae]
MAGDKKVMLNLINEGKEVMITLTMYKNESELVLQRLAQAIERTLRQLEAMGDNLEQASIECIIESKLPAWILDKVYQQKEEKGP